MGGYPGEDRHAVVPKHHRKKGAWEEVPRRRVKFGAHILFVEDQLTVLFISSSQRCIRLKTVGRGSQAARRAPARKELEAQGEVAATGKRARHVPPQPRVGSFRFIRRRTRSAPVGYDRLIAAISANLPLRQWADW